MVQKVKWVFYFFTFVGVGALTLAFFDIGRDFFDRYLYYFLAFLWSGLIGTSILKRIHNKQNKK